MSSTTVVTERLGLGTSAGSSRHLDARRQRWGCVFVAPFTVLFLVFLVAPLLYAFWLSLHTKALIGGTKFTWFANYAKAFSDPQFLDGVWLVVRFSLVLIPI